MTAPNRVFFATAQRCLPALPVTNARMFHVANQIKKGIVPSFSTPQRSFSSTEVIHSYDVSHPEFPNQVKEKAKQCLAAINNTKEQQAENLAKIKQEQANILATLADTCFAHSMFAPATDLYRMLHKIDKTHPSLGLAKLAIKYQHESLPGF